MKPSVVVCIRRTTVALFDRKKNDGTPSHQQPERKAVEGEQVKTGKWTLHSEKEKITLVLFFGSGFFRFKEDDESQTNNMKAVFSVFRTSQICSTISNVTTKCNMTKVVVVSLHSTIMLSFHQLVNFVFFFCGVLFSRSAPDAAVEPKTGEFPLLTIADVPVLYQAPKYFVTFPFAVSCDKYLFKKIKTIVISSLNKK